MPNRSHSACQSFTEIGSADRSDKLNTASGDCPSCGGTKTHGEDRTYLHLFSLCLLFGWIECVLWFFSIRIHFLYRLENISSRKILQKFWVRKKLDVERSVMLSNYGKSLPPEVLHIILYNNLNYKTSNCKSFDNYKRIHLFFFDLWVVNFDACMQNFLLFKCKTCNCISLFMHNICCIW